MFSVLFQLEIVEKSFFHLLNICIINARVMFTSIAGNKNVSNLDFRIGIVHGLLLGWERNATRNLRCYTAIEFTGNSIILAKTQMERNVTALFAVTGN